MELTWVNKLRIAAVAALGIVVIGILAWPLAAPEDPLLPVRAWHVGPLGTIVLLVLAFAVGLAAYFIAWPHGREMGILAAPLGLAVWAGRSAPMRALTQACPEPRERAELLASLRLEPVYWLLIVAAGFVGVLVAQRVRTLRPGDSRGPSRDHTKNTGVYASGLLAVLFATVALPFLIGVFAQDLGDFGVATQPAIGQIIFSVVAAFAVVAFVVRKFLALSYLWPALASMFVLVFADALYYKPQIIQHFAETRPATVFPHSIFTILPVQLVALGVLGSVIGYWLAVQYDYWRKHQNAG